MKKLLSVTLAALMLGGCMTGCAPKEEPTVAENGKEAINISIVHYMTEETKRNALQKLCDDYSAAHPEVTFEVESVAFAQYDQTIKTRISADDMPDIISGRPAEWREFVDGGHIMALNDEEFIQSFSEDFRTEMTIDGNVFGLPVDTGFKGVFYNKDMFEEYGCEVPETYSDFVKVMETFDAAGIAPFARPFKDTNAPATEFKSSFTPTVFLTAPDMWAKISAGEATLTDYPQFKEELAKFGARMDYLSLDDYANDPSRALQFFAAGEVPMEINGSWIIGDMYKNNPDGNFGFFPVPWSEDPALNMFDRKTDDVLMASSHTKNPEVVADFLAYVASEDGAKTWMEISGLMTANVNVELEGASSLLMDIDKMMKAGKSCYTFSVTEPVGEVKNVYHSALHAFVGDPELRADIDGFIAELEADIATALKK